MAVEEQKQNPEVPTPFTITHDDPIAQYTLTKYAFMARREGREDLAHNAETKMAAFAHFGLPEISIPVGPPKETPQDASMNRSQQTKVRQSAGTQGVTKIPGGSVQAPAPTPADPTRPTPKEGSSEPTGI